MRVSLRLRGPHVQDTEVRFIVLYSCIVCSVILLLNVSRLLITGDFLFSTSFDKTAKAWLFDVAELGEGNEERACVRTFKVRSSR